MSGRVVLGRFGPPRGESLRVIDRQARREAQRRFDRPLILQAGAGTGKTTTLVARLLAWTLGAGWNRVLERRAARPAALPVLRPEGEASPERTAADVLRGVVAITFTEAAAAEMASRAARELGVLAQEPPERWPGWLDVEVLPPPEETARRARALLGALDHLAVRTIHAFCLGLLAEHPLEAGVHPSLMVDAEGRLLEEVVREVVEGMLREGYGTPGDPHLLGLATRGFGPQEVAEALFELARVGLPPAVLDEDPFGPGPIADFRERLTLAAGQVYERIAPRLGGPEGKIRNAREIERSLSTLIERLTREEDQDAGLQTLRVWVSELLPGNLVGHLKKWGKSDLSATEASLLGEVRDELAAGSAVLCRLVDHLGKIDPELLEHGRRALGPLLAGVERELHARGIATFDALLTGAASLLASHPEVRSRVRRGIDQLLVDEFQDTDRVQCDILRWIALEGPRDERPGLFLVGDPKQSIYGWRSADLRAYDGFVELARKHGGEVMPLVENFRSVPAILAEVARVVEPVMRHQPGVQPPFEPLLPCERRQEDPGFVRGGPAMPRAAVEHWVSWTAEDGAPGPGRGRAVDRVELEAAALAADIRALHDEEQVPWKDVAILLRGTGDLDLYLEALRRAHVPFAVGRDKQYYRRREVIEASALVRAVLDAGDHLALLTVLRSAVVGVPDAALIPLWRRDFPKHMTELRGSDARLPERLARVREAIEAAAREVPQDVPGIDRVRGWEKGLLAAVEHLAILRQSFETEPADLFVERLRSLFPIEAVEAARYLGPYRLANLDRFFRQLQGAVEEGGGDLTAILRALRRSVAEAREAEEGRPQEGAEDAVQVLTIHGAKGLDFGHVYLAQLHKPPRPEGINKTEAGRLADGGIEVRLFGAPTLGFDRVEAERREVEAAERVRTLYVAMTRAKDRLVLAAAWPEEPAAPRSVEHSRTHLDLLLARQDLPVEPLAVLWDRGRAGQAPAFEDPAGALWKFPAHWPALQDGGGPLPERDGAGLPGPGEVARASAQLAGHRAAAAARMARPWGAAASEEAHALLREEQAERRLASDGKAAPAGEPPEEQSAEPAASTPIDRETAMAVGSAIHRVLETWDLAADPRRELARQRSLLPAWLAPLARGEVLEKALPHADRLLDHLGGSRLLERLRTLRDHVLARELAVLLPPWEGPHAPVGAVTGAVDLLYRDPDTGRLVVADYKTDEVTAPEDLQRRAQTYAPQGATYVRALREALDLAEPPRFELWFLQADRVVEV